MPTTFGHVAIVARDVERLAAFYVDVLGCVRTGPPRDLSGEALARGMGLEDARVRGVHLALPGGSSPSTDREAGRPQPVLEIFSLPETSGGDRPVNRLGLMHLAFRVDDVDATLVALLAAGGSAQGAVAHVRVPGVGSADFVYARDPEGNVVELQAWA